MSRCCARADRPARSSPRGRRVRAAVRRAGGRWLLPAAAAAHLALTARWRCPAASSERARRLAGARPARAARAAAGQRALPRSARSTRSGYLRYRRERSNRVFCACLLAFLGMMTLVTWSHHLGLMWVAIEATTLATAPLIYFNRTPRSHRGDLEVPARRLGRHRPGAAGHRSSSPTPSLHAAARAVAALRRSAARGAPQLSKPWLHAAFVLLLVGYGTKMGLAPMHTWKPDAYGEAPGRRRRAARRRRHQLRLPRAPARLPHLPRRPARAPIAATAAGLHGPALDGRRRRVHGRPARLQAHARLLQRRAHGHPGAGPRHRRRRRLRRAAPPGQQRPDQGRALPLRRQHPPRLRQQDAPTRCAARCGGCRSRARSSWPASSRSPARRRSGRSSASSRS